MHEDAAASGIGITAAADPRVTHLGRVLRRSRLDELPQLWNVVRGEMALVGPRPEDPRFVDWDDPLHALVFRALPGITGPTALAFRDEELMLAEAAVARARANGRTEADLKDIEQAYREGILPRKLAMDADYLQDRSIRSDLAVIARTLMAIAGKPHGARRSSDG
jgi:lipopolysaccharide/colanic/teichoic acid biosynthesis glycosyltransferase